MLRKHPWLVPVLFITLLFYLNFVARVLLSPLAPVMAVTVAAGRRSWFGEDFGRTCDLTVFWPLQDMPGLAYHTPFILELRDCPFTQQENKEMHANMARATIIK